MTFIYSLEVSTMRPNYKLQKSIRMSKNKLLSVQGKLGFKSLQKKTEVQKDVQNY